RDDRHGPHRDGRRADPPPQVRLRASLRRLGEGALRGPFSLFGARWGRGGPYRSGKKRSSSRFADSGESEPCTRFSVISTAKSPRIVPGGASRGFVGPISVRTTDVASGPSATNASTGPDVMNESRSP